MKAFIISDSEFTTEKYLRLSSQLKDLLSGKGFEIEEIMIDRDMLAFCKGCFGCWVKKPGECVISDAIAGINRKAITSDLVVYLCPIVFGQYSANMKCVIDRWLPNMLPFFLTRPDGSTMHPPRYKSYPCQFMIGYGDGLLEEDEQLFLDIILKHRSNVTAFVYGEETDLSKEFASAGLKRVEGNL